jgi:CubicO group peptidase (beta-lactamase class C family)
VNQPRMSTVISLLAFLGIVQSATCSAGEFDAIREQIRRILVRDSLPSIAVAVSRDDKVLWEEGFGWADREGRIPATEHTMYPIASISKPITATALMVLRQRGALDLDRPVNEHLGEAKLRARVGHASEATVRRMANHTSGLPSHYQSFYAGEPDRPPAMEETIRRYGVLMNAPGERFHYSNLNYGVLGHVIARVSGTDLDRFLLREVFLPLGMTRSSVGIGPGLEKHRAILYGTDGRRLPPYETAHPGASDIYCSAHDLLRFGMFHLKIRLDDQKPILSDEAIDEMQRPTATMGKDSYGIGWVVGTGRNHTGTVGHGGGMAGAQGQLVLVPSAKVAVVVMVNADNRRAVDELTRAILDVELQVAADDPHPIPGRQPAQTLIPSSALTRLSGTWRGRVETHQGQIALMVQFKEAGDVHVRLGEQLETLLNKAKFEGDQLTGVMQGDIGTSDANRRPYHLHLDLKLREGSLSGAVVVISLPNSRGGAMAYWVELKKG